jgi:hypothetical protein
MMNGNPPRRAGWKIIAGDRIGFFYGPKMGGHRWFFDIYIQGSKYNF